MLTTWLQIVPGALKGDTSHISGALEELQGLAGKGVDNAGNVVDGKHLLASSLHARSQNANTL